MPERSAFSAFATARMHSVYARCHARNAGSAAVMERLGMAYRAGLDFDHPKLAEGDPLRRHVTYSMARTKAAA